MNFRTILQCAAFVVQGWLILLALLLGVHFEIARLLCGICVLGVYLTAGIFVVFKLALWLWKWSGRLASLIVRDSAVVELADILPEEKRGQA
jgi:uncharacterized membrane protein